MQQLFVFLILRKKLRESVLDSPNFGLLRLLQWAHWSPSWRGNHSWVVVVVVVVVVVAVVVGKLYTRYSLIYQCTNLIDQFDYMFRCPTQSCSTRIELKHRKTSKETSLFKYYLHDIGLHLLFSCPESPQKSPDPQAVSQPLNSQLCRTLQPRVLRTSEVQWTNDHTHGSSHLILNKHD